MTPFVRRAGFQAQGTCSSPTGEGQPQLTAFRTRIGASRAAFRNLDSAAGVDAEGYVYHRLRDSLTTGSGLRAKKQRVSSPPEVAHDALAQLRECLAHSGALLHTSATEELIRAHAEADLEVDRLSEPSSAMLSRVDTLYTNISRPLSATICHSGKLETLPIATHLANLQKLFKEAEEKLRNFAKEYDACCLSQQSIMRRLIERSATSPDHEDESASEVGQGTLESFKREARDLADNVSHMIEAVDEDYKASLQAETMKMMQCIMEG